jgi:hypothetical protein
MMLHHLQSIASVLLICIATAAAGDVPTATVVSLSGLKITLDGRPDEPAWKSASVLHLAQQSPSPGAPTPFETEVRVLMSGDALYFGFTCHDPNPERIAKHTMQRDGDQSGDDTVAIVLDTYGDRRTGYFFQINAAGARVDGLIDNPESVSLDWDGIWDARTARSSDGWSAEIVIPARTLSFTRGLRSWGLNLQRFIPRRRMALRWSSITLDSFLYDFSRAGTLTGIEALEEGKGIDISPYVTGKTKRFFGVSPRAWQSAEGGDATWRMTPQLAAVFTVNTDFAETEADARQINLSRFPLFFPEKRQFFLEGANQFAFAAGLNEQFIPFFSRNIGLLDGAQIPLNGGVKLDGRVGKWNIGLLDVQTRETVVPGDVVRDLGLSSSVVLGTNLLAARVSYDVTENLRVGSIFTHGDPEALRSNTLAGFDAVLRTSKFRGDKNLVLSAWGATTQGDVPAGDRSAWGVRADYPNDLLDCNGKVNQFGDGFDPLLGFLPRPGTRQTDVGCAFQPRPSKDGPFRWIRQEFFENEYSRVTDSQGIVESWEYFMAPINVRMETGDRFEFNWSPRGETLLVPFEISPGVVLPPGSYHFTRWRFEAQTSSHRPLQFGTTTWFGGFYNGHLTQQENYVKWTSPKGRVQVGLETENDFARLQQGGFVQRLWELQTSYAWNPNLVLTSFVQYDTKSQNVGTNTRLRWTIRPGNDLFIVWNRGWQRLFRDPHSLNLVPSFELVAVKLRWTFRP